MHGWQGWHWLISNRAVLLNLQLGPSPILFSPVRLFLYLPIRSEGYVVAAGDVYHEYETGPLKYDDPGTVRGNALKVWGWVA